MTLQLAGAQTFTINLRIPVWARGANLKINGETADHPLQPGQFAAIRREWRPSDRVELELPLLRSLESVDAQHPDTVALLAGPRWCSACASLARARLPLPVARSSLLAARGATANGEA